jgi:lysosomal acid lipase/cholesteryl ester hydrolase
LEFSRKTMKAIIILSALLGLAACAVVPETKSIFSYKSSADRIRSHGYPVETHTVQTSDAYILTMFRIPYSPKLQNQDVAHKPVAFLQHGLLSSSDCWILNGPRDALAYMLVDAGYDVWMGNARGNTYSRKHATKNPLFPSFWDFEWNEIGTIDLPAMIDYVLYFTNENALHYVGHSQGTTSFFVLLSTIPRYNSKIKSSHMLAPVGFMDHMRSPFARAAAPFLGKPSILSDLFGGAEFMPNNKFMSMLGAEACRDKSTFQGMCGNCLFLIAGWDSQHLNYTLLPDVMETHPAGASSTQLVHYLQEYESGQFRKLDFGSRGNKKVYNSKYPPPYLIENIRPQVPVEFYYSDNDYFSDPVDVMRLADVLGKNVNMYHVKYTDWNHLDFLWAMRVKSVVNDRVVQLANDFEAKFGSK